MAYASQAGRARTSSKNPQAHAICDRCGFRYNFVNLQWQYDWRGAALQNLRILVCNTCLDTPQEQLRAIVVPADPTPIINARTENYAADETDYRAVSAPTVYDPTTGIPIPSSTDRITQDGGLRNTQPIGAPVGLTESAIMPLNQGVAYDVQLPIVSVTAVTNTSVDPTGTNQISVTCSAPHGLSAGSQISVSGLSNNGANGFYSVTVTTATAFTYLPNRAIPNGSLLTSGTIIVTALVGVPYNYSQIPQTGI